MVISPVQTKSIVYRRVYVAPVLDESDRVKPGMKAAGFDWSDVNLGIETGVGTREDQVDNPVDFLISLRIKLDNKEGKETPYLLDIEAVALLRVSANLPAERREELAEVNGLAIVYGAIREMVVGLTSRMEYGSLVLPGVHFQDHAKAGQLPEGAEKRVSRAEIAMSAEDADTTKR